MISEERAAFSASGICASILLRTCSHVLPSRFITRAVRTLESLPEVSGVATAYNLPYRGSSGDNVYLPDDDRGLFNIADQYECSDGFYDLMDSDHICPHIDVAIQKARDFLSEGTALKQ